MKACFQIAECSFSSAKIAKKNKLNKVVLNKVVKNKQLFTETTINQLFTHNKPLDKTWSLQEAEGWRHRNLAEVYPLGIKHLESPKTVNPSSRSQSVVGDYCF